MVHVDFLTTLVHEDLLYRDFISHPGGNPPGPLFQAVPEGGTVILIVVLFLPVFYLILLLSFETYKNTSTVRRQRFRSRRTTSQVLALAPRASWGPKSPARAGTFILLLCGLLGVYHEDFMTTLNANAMPWWPEGSGPATRSGEANTNFASQFPNKAKPSGLGSTHQRLDNSQHFPKKKSYIRALKRAQLHGHTWYKGKLYTAQMLGVTPLPWQVSDTPMTSLGQPNSSPPAKLRKNRLQGLSWNIGSLGTFKFDILRQWMHQQQLDLIQLQDTRWGFTGDWTDNTFAYIHSGSHDRAGGLLTIIRKAFCHPDRLSWREVSPGRLLHARLYLDSTGLDLVNFYQHPWTGSDQQCRDKRSGLLDTLDGLLAGLPQRNVVILAGDFNSSLPRTPHCVGLHDFQGRRGRLSGTQHQDAQLLADILPRRGLLAINTWDTSLGPTYQGGQGHLSRIDYVMVRHKTSDSITKKPIYLEHLPGKFGHTKDHVPILFNLPYKWRGWKQPPLGLNRIQQDLLQRHWHLQSTDWHHWRQDLGTRIDNLRDQTPNLEALNQVLMDACLSFQPSGKSDKPSTTNYWSWASTLSRLHLPDIAQRAHHSSKLEQIFGSWLRVTRIQKWRRAATKSAREAKKQKLQDTIDTARHHWSTNDTRRYFKVVNSLTPKHRPPRPQLRKNEGMLMSPEDELRWILDYMEGVYEGTDLQGVNFQLHALPFGPGDITHSLRSLYGHTSVPAHVAPSFIWKSMAEELGSLLYSWLSQWMAAGHIPREWRTGWVVLLPKPNKKVTEPKALRPIALQTPLSKTIMSMFVHEPKKHVLRALTWYPQFAYLPGRGTWEAISRVQAHARAVQALHHKWRYEAGKVQAPGETKPQVFGGCQLFLDMTGAFDAMPREHLQEAFKLLGLPQDLSALLLCWHTETSYIVQWKGLSAVQPTHRGVRQGCRGAPFFWACFIALALERVAAETSTNWMRECCTFYADDGHACFLFHDFDELHFGLVCFGKLITTLEQLGMTVNMHKSAVVVRWGGTKHQQARKLYVKRKLEHQVLRIPKDDGTFHEIPIKEKHEYLGIQMGYFNFQRDTMKARLQASKLRFKQMHRWFSKNSMHAAQKVALWQTCILPIGIYGLDATGTDSTSIPIFSKAMTTMMRQAAGDHSFQTHKSHHAFFLEHHLQHPVAVLRGRMASQLHRHEARLVQLHEMDVLHTLDLDSLRCSINLVDTWLQELSTSEPGNSLSLAEAGLECYTCGLTFRHFYTLKRHETFSHGILHTNGPPLDIGRDSIDGRPTCRHCGEHFISWQNFRHHISSFACNNFDPTKAPPEQLHAFRTRLLDYYDGGDLEPLVRDRPLCYFLSQRCILCGFWSSRLQQMSAHMGRDHGDIYALMGDVLPNVVRARATSPCELCEQAFRSRTHTCPVKKQLGLALAYRKHREQFPASLPPVPQPPQRMEAQFSCGLCPRKFVTAAGLHQHQVMDHTHSTTTRTFVAGRDQVPGQTQCAHCQSKFLSLAALRHHIDGGHCSTPPDEDPPLLWHHPLIISGLHGGTFDHLMAYKSLIRRLGYICGLCGHQSGSSVSLLKHLGNHHNEHWPQATSYAEWLQTDGALRNLGCSCLRPPKTPHVCTVFTQLALFVHHDLTRLHGGSDDVIMSFALRLDLQVLSPTISLSFPDLDSKLATGLFAELIEDDTLCTALSTWCCLCGRQIDPRDMLQHLWNQHAKHANRGSLFYKYLTMFQVKQTICSICKCHPTAAQCPILLQLASLLAILHHGHGDGGSLRDAGSTEPMGQDGGRRGEECQEAPIHHVEWREGAGKRKRKGQVKNQNTTGESTPNTNNLLQVLSRLVLRHEDTLQCLATETDFFVFLSAGPGSILPCMMTQTTTWHQTPQSERTHPLRILVLKALLEELVKRAQKLQSTACSDPLIQTLQRLGFLKIDPENGNQFSFPRMKWDHQKQVMEAQEDAPLTVQQALHTLSRMLTLLQQEDLIKRFGALRPAQQIQKVMTTDTDKPSTVIPWRVTLALTNPHSTEMRGLWHQLSHSGLWQLILGRMRPATQHRTPLAQHLGKLLGDL